MKKKGNEKVSFVHLLSRYFTLIVLIIAGSTAVYWQINDPSKIWPAVTAIFIIACPCALLLANSFTNGNILSILSRNHFYLRNAQIIEEMAKTTHIVFDKTGTLTTPRKQDIVYEGRGLNTEQEEQIAAVAGCTSHPLGKALAGFLDKPGRLTVEEFRETTGEGIKGIVKGNVIKLGRYEYITGIKNPHPGTVVFASINNKLLGSFHFSNHYREEIPELVSTLKNKFRISVLSGDNSSERETLKKMMGRDTALLFHQKPEDKLNYIKYLQQQGEKVMMIGDGLNDAGALKQSDTGIAVSEQVNNFTPGSDAIIEANQLSRLYQFIRLTRANRHIVIASFILSILYNIIGLYFAVQGTLSPLIAAILMPSSSLSILLITFGSSNLLAGKLGLLHRNKQA